MTNKELIEQTSEITTPVKKARREAVLFIRTAETQEDYNVVREAFKNIVVMGQKALANLVNLASDIENPKAYEHVSSLLSSIADAAERMMKLQAQVRDLEDRDHSNEKLDTMLLQENRGNVAALPSMHIENATIFAGTTDEVLKRFYHGQNEPTIIEVSANTEPENVISANTIT